MITGVVAKIHLHWQGRQDGSNLVQNNFSLNMAATTEAASALLGPLAPPPVGTTATSAKTMQHLLNEIDTAKMDVESAARKLEKIDTGRRKGAANRDQSVEGRTQIRDLRERVVNLQRQMDAMTKTTDPNWPISTFDKTKRNALKTITNLSNKLNQVDKHLEKATGATPVPAAPPVDTQSTATPANAQPAVVPVAPVAEENTRGIGAFISKLPFGGKKKSASKESLASTAQAVPAPSTSAKETGDGVQKATKDEEAHEDDDDVEEGSDADDDDDDVVSDRKKGK